MKKLILLSLIGLSSTLLLAQPQKKVLVEKFTSAYCGNCPRATNQLLQLEADHPEVIWVAHHSKWVVRDSMHFPELDPYYDDFTNSAPRATINRVQFSGQSQVAAGTGAWNTYIPAQIDSVASVYVNMNGSYNTTSREITLDVVANFYSAPTSGDLRITAFLIENNVQVSNTAGYNQANYDNNNTSSPLYNLGNPILNYSHKNVTRAILSDVWGTTGVIPSTPALNQDYMQQYSYTVPASFDVDNCSLVAFVSYYDADKTKREILNANNISVGDLTQILPSTSAFMYNDSNLPTIQFTDNSTNTPTSWLWDFGDGTTSTDQNPSHIYTQNNTYTVCLTASNEAGSNGDVCQNVEFDFTSSNENLATSSNIKTYPNPVNDNLTIELSEELAVQPLSVQLTDIIGKLAYQKIVAENQFIQISMEHLPKGIYIVSLKNNEGILVARSKILKN